MLTARTTTILSSMAVAAALAAGPPATCGEPVAEARRSFEVGRQTESLALLERASRFFARRARGHDVDGEAHYDLARTLSELGDYYLRAGDRERATRLFDEGIVAGQVAVVRAPHSSERLTVLGDLHGQRAGLGGLVRTIRHGRAAAALYERAVALDPKNPLAHVGVGIAQLETPAMFGGSVEGALAQFRLAQRLDPTCATAWVWEGIAQRRQGAFSAARRAFEHALGVDPNNGHARRELAALDEDS